jgi:hypothetical protein
MKRLNLFLVGLAALTMTMVFTSCEEESTSAPSVNFTNGVNEATTDKSPYTITGTITSEVGLKTVRLLKVTTDGEDQIELIEKFDDKNSYAFQFDVTVSEDMTVKVEATDKDNQVTSRNFVITYTGGAAGISEFSAVLMGAQNNTTNGSTASLETGTVYKISGDEAKTNSDKVDIVYYYGTKEAALYAPSQTDIQAVSAFQISTWATKNATKLGISTLTSAEFDAISSVSGITSAGSSTLDVVPNLKANDVISFETASGKKGVFKVSSIVTGDKGSISISVKVEK